MSERKLSPLGRKTASIVWRDRYEISCEAIVNVREASDKAEYSDDPTVITAIRLLDLANRREKTANALLQKQYNH